MIEIIDVLLVVDQDKWSLDIDLNEEKIILCMMNK